MLAVAHNGMVAGEGQHSIDTKRGCAQHIAHNGHTAAVAAGDLQNRLDAGLLQVDAKAQGRSLQAGGLHIGDVDAVNLALEQFRVSHLVGKIITLGRSHLRGDGKLAIQQCFF